ncbi:MAG: hypothetical protein KDB23_21170 [Planctomycetales bacterium]|nr:hypothetical protein [Planctomycetales bacterium]
MDSTAEGQDSRRTSFNFHQGRCFTVFLHSPILVTAAGFKQASDLWRLTVATAVLTAAPQASISPDCTPVEKKMNARSRDAQEL